MVRSLLISALVVAAGGGCLLPPEGRPVETNAPPVVTLEQVLPPLTLLQISAGVSDTVQSIEGGCPAFDVLVPSIFDPDSGRLLLRLVANNGLGGAKILEDLEVRRDPGEVFDFGDTVVPSSAFPETVARVSLLGDAFARLTLFVTDAAAFELPEDAPAPTDNEFGRVLGSPGGREPRTARVDWTLIFTRDDARRCP